MLLLYATSASICSSSSNSCTRSEAHHTYKLKYRWTSYLLWLSESLCYKFCNYRCELLHPETSLIIDKDILRANLSRLTWKAIIVAICTLRRLVHITSVARRRKRVCVYDESLLYRCRLSRRTPLSHQCRHATGYSERVLLYRSSPTAGILIWYG